MKNSRPKSQRFDRDMRVPNCEPNIVPNSEPNYQTNIAILQPILN